MKGNIAFPQQLADVNTTDLAKAIRDGCKPMQLFFDPTREHLPYFGNMMTGDDPRSSHFENYSISHVPGRWSLRYV